MKSILSSLVAGIVFGFGLIVSEMVNPRRVRGFLDVTGNWDPTLLFVMGGALIVAAIGYRLVLSRQHPLFAPNFSVPTKRIIDWRLVLGASLFGIGWGLSGLCPGPAIVGVTTANGQVIIFFIAMIVGMKLFEQVNRQLEKRPEQTSNSQVEV